METELRVYSTKTGAPLLGIKQDTLKFYASESGIGSQPGGKGTPYIFTHNDLLAIREWQKKHAYGKKGSGRNSLTQQREDRQALGVGPMYYPDGRPGS